MRPEDVVPHVCNSAHMEDCTVPGHHVLAAASGSVSVPAELVEALHMAVEAYQAVVTGSHTIGGRQEAGDRVKFAAIDFIAEAYPLSARALVDWVGNHES